MDGKMVNSQARITEELDGQIRALAERDGMTRQELYAEFVKLYEDASFARANPAHAESLKAVDDLTTRIRRIIEGMATATDEAQERARARVEEAERRADEDVAAVKGALGGAEQRIKDLEGELDAKKKEASDAGERAEELRKQLDAMTKRAEELEQRAKDGDEAVERAKAAEDAAADARARADLDEERRERAEERLEHVESDAKAAAELAAEKINNAEQNLERARRDAETAATRAETLEGQLREEREARVAAERRADKAEATADALESQVKTYEMIISRILGGEDPSKVVGLLGADDGE